MIVPAGDSDALAAARSNGCLTTGSCECEWGGGKGTCDWSVFAREEPAVVLDCYVELTLNRLSRKRE